MFPLKAIAEGNLERKEREKREAAACFCGSLFAYISYKKVGEKC